MRTQPRPEQAHPPRPLAPSPHSAVHKKRTPPPVLASDVLREDLAPIEPGRRASRLWDAGLALLYLAVGICLRLDLGVTRVSPDAGAACLAAGVGVGATALVSFPYLWRAIVAGVIGAGVVILGLFGGGRSLCSPLPAPILGSSSVALSPASLSRQPSCSDPITGPTRLVG